MRKRILIGSMLVLTLLFLMPSIPAIQQRTVEDIEVLDDIKHPILYEFVYLIYAHREMRLNRVLNIAVDAGFGYFEVRHPLLLLWAYWLGITSAIWFSFWKGISDNIEWGWFEDY